MRVLRTSWRTWCSPRRELAVNAVARVAQLLQRQPGVPGIVVDE